VSGTNVFMKCMVFFLYGSRPKKEDAAVTIDSSYRFVALHDDSRLRAFVDSSTELGEVS